MIEVINIKDKYKFVRILKFIVVRKKKLLPTSFLYARFCHDIFLAEGKVVKHDTSIKLKTCCARVKDSRSFLKINKSKL